MTKVKPKYQHWQLTYDIDHIAWLTLDRQGESVNTLSSEVINEFDSILNDLEQELPKGLVIQSGKSTGFIAGADVREFDGHEQAKVVTGLIQQVHAIFNRLEKLKCYTVAAIEGFCLGGGLELALACNYRIAKDVKSTKIGFPEVKLGIFPGFGGSARSIHKIGGLAAMQTMLTARNLSARAAKATGLIDQVVGRHEELRWTARHAILKHKKPQTAGFVGKLSNINPVRGFLSKKIRQQTAKKANPKHYPAPFALIDAWEKYGDDKKAILQAEAIEVGKLMVGETATNLRRVFYLMETLKQIGKAADFKVKRVHVIGAGVMGGDIAAWCAFRGLEVTLQDQSIDYVNNAINRAKKLFKKKLKTSEKIKAALTRMIPDIEGNHIQQADVIIEAIIENKEAKQVLYKTIEPKLNEHAILATNTSAIPLEELATALKQPERLLGLHFFNPVAKMPLVEIVKNTKTKVAEINKAAAFCSQIGKFPLPVASSPGFLVNRVLAPYMIKALSLLKAGVAPEAIDQAAINFGMPMGPVELADTVGLDVCLMVTDVLGSDTHKAEKAMIQSYIDKKHLGKKTQRGLYQWKAGKPIKNKEKAQHKNLQDITAKLIKPYLDECEACLKEKIVKNKDLLDAGMIFGTGFPPFRGGPLHYIANSK